MVDKTKPWVTLGDMSDDRHNDNRNEECMADMHNDMFSSSSNTDAKESHTIRDVMHHSLAECGKDSCTRIIFGLVFSHI